MFDAGDFLAQHFIIALHAVVLFVDPAFLTAQTPQVQGAAIPDEGNQGKQENQRTEQIERPAWRQVKLHRS